MSVIAVADFGVGNLHSVIGALYRVAPDAQVAFWHTTITKPGHAAISSIRIMRAGRKHSGNNKTRRNNNRDNNKGKHMHKSFWHKTPPRWHAREMRQSNIARRFGNFDACMRAIEERNLREVILPSCRLKCPAREKKTHSLGGFAFRQHLPQNAAVCNSAVALGNRAPSPGSSFIAAAYNGICGTYRPQMPWFCFDFAQVALAHACVKVAIAGQYYFVGACHRGGVLCQNDLCIRRNAIQCANDRMQVANAKVGNGYNAHNAFLVDGTPRRPILIAPPSAKPNALNIASA